MAKKMIYVRLVDGYGVSKPIKDFVSLIYRDNTAEIALENGQKGFVSRNMARRILKVRPDILHKHSHNGLVEWLMSEAEAEPDDRDWLEKLQDALGR